MKWITREKIKIDRVSSAWLIQKFVDAEAKFLFAPRAEVMTRAAAEGATPYHIPDAELGQGGGKTAFDKIVAKYTIDDTAVTMMADIVRAADRRLAEPAEGASVAAMSNGFTKMGLSDEEVLRLQLPLWEALYHFCRSKVGK